MNRGLLHEPRSGKTRRVWDIADEITRRSGRMARRKEVIDRVLAEGGNTNTASTQYHYWRLAREGKEEVPHNMGPARLTLASDGRLVIPAEMRRAMRLDDSGRVTARVVEGELRVTSQRVALEQARAMVRAFDTGGSSPVDELIRERRADAERE